MTPETIPNPNVNPRRYSPFWFRLLEILPGGVVWLALLAPFALSFSYPFTVTIFIIVFDVYWLTQTLNQAYYLIIGYSRLKKQLDTNWEAKFSSLAEMDAAEREAQGMLNPRDLYQTIILTTYKEEQAILEASIQSVVDAHYDPSRLIMVLATEERDAENARTIAAALKAKFAQHFFLFLVTEHPDNIVGEVKAKGANATWAAKQLVAEVSKAGISLDHIVVSTADADSRFNPHYFHCLSYAYAVLPDRVHCSFQPVATYFNNIWETPMMSRVLAFGTTFWQLIESVRDYRLITFATHAVSLQTLVDIDYWCTTIVNEDSRQYFRSYFHYKGKFRVVPLYMPIYMDAVHTGNFRKTLRNLYFQQQRWAYGVEHFPYIILECFRHPEIRLLDRFMLIWRAFVGSFSWATSSFFMTFVGWIPILLNNNFRDAVVVSNFVLVTKGLLSLTWIGLIISSILTLKILAIMPYKKRRRDVLGMLAQWILIPMFGIFFGALPGLDAQTRLMLGRYLGFRVTEKSSSKAA